MARLLREAGFIEKTVQDSRQYRECFYQKSMRPSFSIDNGGPKYVPQRCQHRRYRRDRAG
jgi:hypothetical protein